MYSCALLHLRLTYLQEATDGTFDFRGLLHRDGTVYSAVDGSEFTKQADVGPLAVGLQNVYSSLHATSGQSYRSQELCPAILGPGSIAFQLL
jgi:hypothetical protein